MRPRSTFPLLVAGLLAVACGAEEAPAAPDAPPALARPLPLEARRQVALPAAPEWVLARDLDGDGRAELLAATRAPAALHVFRAGEDLALEEAARLPVGEYPLRPVVLAADGGGAPLVALASRARRTLALVAPLEGGATATRWEVELPSTPRALAAGDLGRDGREELAVACDGSRLAIADSSGGLRTLALGAELPRCALVASDGRHVVVGFQDTRALHAILVDDPEAEPVVIELGGIPRALLEADLDGDGDLELVVAGGESEVWMLGVGAEGGPDAWLAGDPTPVVWTSGSIPIDLQALDVDGDGRAELAVLCWGALTWSLVRGPALPEPTAVLSGYAGQTPRSLSVSDLDGDGHNDLAIANRDSHAIGLLRGRDDGGFEQGLGVPVGRFPSRLATGDLQAAGLPDVVTIDSKDGRLTYLANQLGSLRRSQGSLRADGAPRAADCGDLDGDGKVELALATADASGARVEVLRRGRDRLERSGEPLPTGRGARDLLLADLDGDGRDEVLVADDEAGEVVWLVGAEEHAVAHRIAVPDGPRALATIQLDGDPEPEIAVALGGPGERTGVALLDARSGADGLALVEIAAFVTAGAPLDVAAGDLDRDGRDDLVVLANTQWDSLGGHLTALLRRGGVEGPPTFELREPVPTGEKPRHLDAADLDCDGALDVLVAAQNAHAVNVWLSRGGTGGPPWTLLRLDDVGAGLGCLDVIATDLDGDGRPEVVVANAFSDDLTVLRNPAR